MSTTASDHGRLWELIKDMKFGMFTHRHANGRLHSQPLTTLNKSLDGGAKLYFFVSRQSEIAQVVQQDDQVNVSYASPDKDHYVSISGEALIVEDVGRKEALWSPMVKAWFPGGPTDPNLALLEVLISHAEYWDATENKMVQLARMVKAAVTGKPPDIGEHRKLKMP